MEATIEEEAMVKGENMQEPLSILTLLSRTEDEAESISARMCPLMSRLQPAPGQRVSSECWPVSTAGDGMLPSCSPLCPLTTFLFSLVSGQVGSEQVSDTSINMETFFPSSNPQMTSVRYDTCNS